MYFTKLKDYLLSNIQFNILLNSLADLRKILEQLQKSIFLMELNLLESIPIRPIHIRKMIMTIW